MELSAQVLKQISCEDTLYPHIPQELVCGPVVAELGLLVNPHDHVDPNKCSHFLRGGGIPLLVCLSLCSAYRVVSAATRSKKDGSQKRLKNSRCVEFVPSSLTGPGVSENGVWV